MAAVIFVFFSGAVSGLALGFFLKGVESATGKLVYLLLLNIDFIPLAGSVHWPEWVEFCLHLAVSFLIAAAYWYVLDRKRLPPFRTAAFLTLPAVFLYFPLSVLAEKRVAATDDWTAFAWWTAGHAVYAGCLGLFGAIKKRKA